MLVKEEIVKDPKTNATGIVREYLGQRLDRHGVFCDVVRVRILFMTQHYKAGDLVIWFIPTEESR